MIPAMSGDRRTIQEGISLRRHLAALPSYLCIFVLALLCGAASPANTALSFDVGTVGGPLSNAPAEIYRPEGSGTIPMA